MRCVAAQPKTMGMWIQNSFTHIAAPNFRMCATTGCRFHLQDLGLDGYTLDFDKRDWDFTKKHGECILNEIIKGKFQRNDGYGLKNRMDGPRSSRSFLYHWWSHCRFDTNQHQSKDGVGKVWYLRDFTLWCLEIMSPQNHRCQLLGWFVGIPILWFDSVSLLGFLLPVRPTAACARSFIRRSCSFFSAWAQDWSQSSKVEAVTEKPDIDFRGKSAMISCRCSKPNDYPPVN